MKNKTLGGILIAVGVILLAQLSWEATFGVLFVVAGWEIYDKKPSNYL